MNNEKKKLILIDGNAIIHRAYRALPPLTTKKGELVNAVYGFASTLLSVMDKFKPDYILATFDLKAPTFRHEEYKEYKATRVKAPDELYAQIERVKEVTRAFNIPIYEKEGFEADDVIGTLVAQSENFGHPMSNDQSDQRTSDVQIENIIVTGDLDTLQLVSGKTKVYALRRGITDTILYDAEAVKERYGLAPEQMVDYKGLRGDASDNIPGVKGIGEKTAAELLKKYETLEGVYASLAEIKGAVKDKLERDKAQALMSKKLATIVKNAPVKLDFSQAITYEFDRKKVVDLFQELNFFSLIKRLPENQGSTLEEKRLNLGAINGVADFKYELITEDKWEEFVKLLNEQKEVAIYLRTTGPASTRGDRSSTRGGDKYYNSDLQGVGFSWKTGRAAYIVFGERKTKSDLPRRQAGKLKAILENEKIKKVGYDLKYVYEVLKKCGVELKGKLYDTMLAAYVSNPGGKIEFKNLVLEELNEEIETRKPAGQLGLEIESEEDVARKICRAADYIFKLKIALDEKIEKISAGQDKTKNIKTVLENIEIPLVKILAEMEMSGIKLNPIIFQGIAEKISKKIENLEKAVYELAGAEFNINSPKQLAEILFVRMKLPTADIKKGKTGYSTASSELAKLKKENKIVEKIEEYRELAKLKNTYLDVLPKLLDENSRVHTSFNQAVTATGRLSSSDPNLQNIPIRNDIGQLMRAAFVAEDKYKFISADYSQIDLRAAAHISGDKKLIEAFHRGDDIHKITAAEINKVTMSQVTEKMRRAAKALNFGVIYGMSVFGFAEAAGVDRDEARKFIDAYMEKFAGVARYIRETKEFAKKNGYVETEMGRRRYVPEINSPNFQVQNAAERMAINMPIQGMSADIVKLAMIKVAEFIQGSILNGKRLNLEKDIRMLLQVHDEIILEVKENIAAETAKKVKEIMENVYQLKVSLVVDVKIGDNWGEI